MDGFPEFIVWFAFGAPDAARNPQFADSGAWMAVAFATISAIAFVAIVIVDFSAVIVTRIGLGSPSSGALGLKHGW